MHDKALRTSEWEANIHGLALFFKGGGVGVVNCKERQNKNMHFFIEMKVIGVVFESLSSCNGLFRLGKVKIRHNTVMPQLSHLTHSHLKRLMTPPIDE